MSDHFLDLSEQFTNDSKSLGDRMKRQLFNFVMLNYHDLSVSCRSTIYLSSRQIIDLLTTDTT